MTDTAAERTAFGAQPVEVILKTWSDAHDKRARAAMKPAAPVKTAAKKTTKKPTAKKPATCRRT